MSNFILWKDIIGFLSVEIVCNTVSLKHKQLNSANLFTPIRINVKIISVTIVKES